MLLLDPALDSLPVPAIPLLLPLDVKHELLLIKAGLVPVDLIVFAADSLNSY